MCSASLSPLQGSHLPGILTLISACLNHVLWFNPTNKPHGNLWEPSINPARAQGLSKMLKDKASPFCLLSLIFLREVGVPSNWLSHVPEQWFHTGKQKDNFFRATFGILSKPLCCGSGVELANWRGQPGAGRNLDSGVCAVLFWGPRH